MVNALFKFLNEQRTGKPIPSFISDLISEQAFEEARVALNRQMNDLQKIIDEKLGERYEMTKGGIYSGGLLRNLDEELDELQMEFKNLFSAFNSLPDKAPLEIATPQLTLDQISAIDAMKSILEDSITPLEKINALFAQLDMITEDGLGGFSEEDTARIRGHLEGLKADLEDVSATFEEVMAPAIAAAAQAFTSDFVNSLMEGESALDSFKNFSKDIVGQIIATFLQMAVVNKILNAVFGGINGYTPMPTMDIGARASGGSVNGGSPYLVGERGPEMFVPNSGGRIVNGHNTNNMMGGGGGVVVNQTINLSAGVVGTVRSEVQRMMPQIANVTKAGVLEATRRGGTYRRGLLGS